jgi:hypothetical protein
MRAAARRLDVFLSYQMEDSAARADFVSDVTRGEPTVRFFDYPVADSFDVNWRERCAELIGTCHGTIVLVGRTTFQSAPVSWEIAETANLGLPVIGVLLFDDGSTQAPSGLDRAALIPRPDVSSIVFRLRTWSVRGHPGPPRSQSGAS